MEYKDWYANKSDASWIFIMLLTCSINLQIYLIYRWISSGVHLVDKGWVAKFDLAFFHNLRFDYSSEIVLKFVYMLDWE